MPPDSRSSIATWGLLILAAVGFAVQLVTGRPAFGAFGLVLLVVPGFVISQSIRPTPRSRPMLALTTLGLSLILQVLVGITAALSPQGLDASSVAALELAILALVSANWYLRSRRTRALRLPSRVQIAPGSALLIAFGIILAGAGFGLATRSEETQEHAGFVQFWSVSEATGPDALLGLRNAAGVGLDCLVVIVGSNQSPFDWDIGAIADGESWLGELPPPDALGTGPWQISLHCDAPDGTTIDRRLLIDRAAV